MKSFFISLYVLCIMSKPFNSSFTQQSNSNNTTLLSLDLIHRDSLQSPYYNPSLSHTQIIINAIRRSLVRSLWHSEGYSGGSTETNVIRSIHSGDYLMRYAIGEQEVPSLGILDTGSGFIWTQCFPCSDCIKQNPPLYKPGQSSTYKNISCNSIECIRSRHPNLCHKKKSEHCVYYLSYEDGTLSEGWLSKEKFILASASGTTTKVPNIVFGCAYRARSQFYGSVSGVIGLGRGLYSLVRQLGTLAKGKFSYCLVPGFENSKGSRLTFGDNGEVSGDRVVHTPLAFNPKFPTYYFVTLYGFDIGNTLFMFASDDGNVIVDSGWAETRLPYAMFNRLRDALIVTLKLKTIADPEEVFDLCFDTTSDHKWLPRVNLHFKGDHANVSFGKENMFIRTSRNCLCLAVKPVGRGHAILGYYAQANFIVEYDLENEQMSFKPTDCANSPN